MAIRFIHFSDTHLGYSDLDKQHPDGRNIREWDFYSSFETMVDIIIETKPDFAIHTGDIFHRASPGNRTIVFAYQQLDRIAQAGIPFYCVAGNHDFPKTIFTTPIHNIFDAGKKFKIFFGECYETYETEQFIIHAFPHINDENKYLEEAEKIKVVNKTKPNLLFMHLSVEKDYLMNEFGERVFPEHLEPVLRNFDYVGLGHWHKFQHIKKLGNVFYSGSTERISEKETGYEKGYLEVQIDKDFDVQFHALPTRPFFKLKIENCFSKTKEEICNELVTFKQKDDVHDAILSINFCDLDVSQNYIIPSSEINLLFEECLHVTVSKSIKNKNEVISSEAESIDLKELLSIEMKNSFPDEKEFELVRQIAYEILFQLEEEEADAN